MNCPLRLLQNGFHDGYYNMGLDEAFLESVSSGEKPVLRLYGWDPPAVSIGYFQGLADEVDEAACKRRGFTIVRRISGGGAVLHKSELTYSIVLPLSDPVYRRLAPEDINESYRLLCSGIIEGLRLLGIPAVFSGINDILANGKKISGNAQTRRLGCLLQHGTVLLDNDVEEMFEVLKVPKEKIQGKLIAEAKERVTSARAALGRKVSFNEASAAFARGFASALGLEFLDTALLPGEEERGISLAREKFSTREWLYKR